MNNNDMFKGEAAPAASLSTKVTGLIEQAMTLGEQIAGVEDMLSGLRRQLHVLKTKVIPEAMVEAGISAITIEDGSEVEITDFVSGSLPKEPEARNAALHWLEEHGGDGLIKSIITVTFSGSDYEKARKLAEKLAKEGRQTTIDKTVHSSSLQALARERMRNGSEVPLEMLGLYAGQVAKIKPGAAKKGGKA